jgi:transcriptional regulator CtsR
MQIFDKDDLDFETYLFDINVWTVEEETELQSTEFEWPYDVVPNQINNCILNMLN